MDGMQKCVLNQGNAHSLCCITLPGSKKNRPHVSNKMSSIILNKNNIEQEQLKSQHYDNDDDDTIKKASLQIKPQKVSPMLLSSHITIKSNNIHNSNSSNNNNRGMTFALVDRRLKETAKTQERFPSIVLTPPYTLSDTINANLTTLNTTLESSRSAVHIVVMSTETSSF